MNRFFFYLIALLFLNCNDKQSETAQKSPKLSTDNFTYIIFGQFSNDNSSRFKQLYKIKHDSIWIYFKGGQYFDYTNNSWVINEKLNVRNELVTNIDLKRVLPLIKSLPKTMFQYKNTIFGNPKTLSVQGMYIEIGNEREKRVWKINESDKNIPSQINRLDDKLIRAISILDDDEVKD
ncbi:hypothetical protein G6N05_15035 [Flavobacterium sp. F372]|uniref:Lipoprotein n=1 Tax=Flavobacterium bernardetii TaxID=2813823 RepID=A0ABR7J291_9FLAO|nr:hypothetical protein [Flavobacterium bernardetii]MBC5836200.1 hypothetical protein [Flavobacterium bernardetii]NHF71426.1 hypothetical protein [Flavobacterium bernardetii]